MKKFFIIGNVLLICFIIYLFFAPGDKITGSVVLEGKMDSLVIGSRLYYNITDTDTSEVITKDYVKNRTVYLVRKNQTIANFSLIKDIETWTLEKDADGELDYCDERSYENGKHYYDANANDVQDEDEFEFYSVFVDEKGCFNVKLPDDKFIAVIG